MSPFSVDMAVRMSSISCSRKSEKCNDVLLSRSLQGVSSVYVRPVFCVKWMRQMGIAQTED